MSDLNRSEGATRGYLYITKPQVMKAILTVIIILFFGIVSAQSQNTKGTVSAIEVTSIENIELTTEKVAKEEITTTNENKVVRLYRFKNSRVKKALSFRTKRNKSKLA